MENWCTFSIEWLPPKNTIIKILIIIKKIIIIKIIKRTKNDLINSTRSSNHQRINQTKKENDKIMFNYQK